MNKKNLAILYARVSSTEQEKEGFSIPAQQKLLREYARDAGYHVIKEFEEAETAKQSGREQFGAMVRFFKKERSSKKNNRCRVVLVEKTDRLYRNFRDYVELDPDELDIEIHFVKDRVVLSKESKSNDKLMHGFKVLMAKNFCDNLSEETQKGLREKAEQGLWPTVAPVGYFNSQDESGRKTIVADEIRAPLVRKLFEEFATGFHSTPSIVKWAYNNGLRSKRDKRIQKSGIHRILRKRLYTGRFDWKGKTYQGVHEPIVSEELWLKVQDILDGRNAIRPRKTKRSFAFSRFIKCGHCGCSLVGEIQKKKYIYYHCSGFKGKCPEPYVREEVISKQFGEYLKRLVFDKEVIEWVTKTLKESHADETKEREQASRRLKGEYDRLQNRIDAAYVDKLDGRIGTQQFERLSKSWRQEQDELQAALSAYESAGRNYLDDGVRLLELANGAYDLFDKQEMREKRKLLDFVLSNCTWRDGRLSAEYKQPFDMIAETIPKFEVIEGGKASEEEKNQKWGG